MRFFTAQFSRRFTRWREMRIGGPRPTVTDFRPTVHRTPADGLPINRQIASVGLVKYQFNPRSSPVHTCKASARVSARNEKVSIVLRLLHKFHRVNRLLALALHVWTGLHPFSMPFRGKFAYKTRLTLPTMDGSERKKILEKMFFHLNLLSRSEVLPQCILAPRTRIISVLPWTTNSQLVHMIICLSRSVGRQPFLDVHPTAFTLHIRSLPRKPTFGRRHAVFNRPFHRPSVIRYWHFFQFLAYLS